MPDTKQRAISMRSVGVPSAQPVRRFHLRMDGHAIASFETMTLAMDEIAMCPPTHLYEVYEDDLCRFIFGIQNWH